ncbi:leucyl/phenylalanyl-tRNA--protein transferase [Sphingomonas radiodurans]|uniref:leucyl/phenylalanyl-tRNA--protein transferase n=1 Tax=Sphingomonas radiodurans TaxID=2890321 RepID=UPI001E359DD1|nr:leucyl/phenylalanyl-tRNA--protein transferase [Sphingomonas radiodurans]WBH17628.1 leucyl/phenylalanyl-tRNA--protein transferase [Sphingomonas radiodurans]
MSRHRPSFEQLDAATVLGAYAVGVFPMADARDAPGVYWVEPRHRAILPLDHFHLSRSLRRALRSERFRLTADTAFGDVITLCAEAATDRPETWINRSIERVFRELHAAGFAHSIECWEGDVLVGGLYGLALGRAFFGESMVSRTTDASKAALAALVARLRFGGFTLLDCQFMTDHLASLGAIEIERSDYVALLGAALSDVLGSAASGTSWDVGAADFRAVDGAPSTSVAGPLSGNDIVQLLAQTS